MIRVCDIFERIADVSNLKRVATEIADQFPRTRLRGGEVVLTIVGTIGRTAIVPTELRGANVARAVAVLSPLEQVDAEWLQIFLRYEKTKRGLTENAREVARKTLNLEQLREFAMPVPSIHEQRVAISLVNELLSKGLHIEQTLSEQTVTTRAVRLSVLKSAFAGTLVPQDATDEPASLLLERIAIERRASLKRVGTHPARNKKVKA